MISINTREKTPDVISEKHSHWCYVDRWTQWSVNQSKPSSVDSLSSSDWFSPPIINCGQLLPQKEHKNESTGLEWEFLVGAMMSWWKREILICGTKSLSYLSLSRSRFHFHFHHRGRASCSRSRSPSSATVVTAVSTSRLHLQVLSLLGLITTHTKSLSLWSPTTSPVSAPHKILEPAWFTSLNMKPTKLASPDHQPH